MNHSLISKLKHGFIVSCQALEDEPLHGSHIMAAMACAAEEGGAAAIRANSPVDIYQIKQKCSLPVIGIYKKFYDDSKVYITPTIHEVREVVEAGADFVALDCTKLSRPGKERLEDLIDRIRSDYPQTSIVADISTYEEGVRAISLKVDLISTTLSGYTPHSPQLEDPDIELVGRLASLGKVPILAEGRIWMIEQCLRCFDAGAHAVVMGTAITRPQEIVKRYVRKVRSHVGSSS
ncbi:N-acetylmannosamine-6-phosphate 2-epimerase [Paenibacillus beijingensis]|uniref:Putative N-acetylmannosamine-6-phosphate 2-epimerase n=1 Tax=Paenibacillus beijingensis TaxID=1126833 RepID=A0A0D5NGC6_9BACL|nr:N-acetylmannosamine-6-phosphate 2-epimerase [Paenibacillus beijingensis]AJY74311.1 N-acetylmannosamine-6-phosphate 2-epimerase [Paenibacillus beijingensis]